MFTQEVYPADTHTFLPEVVSSLQGNVQHYDKYDFVYLNKSDMQKIFYVRKGLVRLGMYTEEGKEVTYCLVEEGAIIGNFSFQHQHGKPFAQAFSEVELLAFSEWEVRKLFQQGHSATFEIFRLMGEHLRTMEEQFKMLAYSDVHQRIIRFIMYLADLYGYRHERVTYIPHSFTHEDISRIIHTSRQTVTVTLRELQQQGYLSYNRGEFRIYRYEELAGLTT